MTTELYIQLNEPGSGSAQINKNDTAAADVVNGKYIKVSYRGEERGGFFIDNLDKVEAAERDGQDIEMKGRGAMGVLDQAILFDDGTPDASTRTFSAITIGDLASQLIDEAQLRGCFPNVVKGFTSTLDSDGDAWVTTHDFDLRIGDSYLEIIKGLVDKGVDIEVDFDTTSSNFLLNIFQTPIGSTVTDDVVFRVGDNCTKLTTQESISELKNAYLFRTQGAEYNTSDDAPSIASHGRKEAYYDAGQSPNSTEGGILVGAELDRTKDPEFAVDIELEDAVGAQVFVDYNVGDIVGYSDEGGVVNERRIIAMVVRWDVADRFASVGVTLEKVILDQELKNIIQVRRLNPGTTAPGAIPEDTNANIGRSIAIHDGALASHAALLRIDGSRAMTGDLDMNSKRVNNPKDIQFKTGLSAPAHSEGVIFYDETNKALSYYIDEPDVTLQIGQEQWLRVNNTSGGLIANGEIVYISGASSGLPTIELALADKPTTADRIIGVATHDIENGTQGIVTTFGAVRDVDTSLLTPGDKIYLSASSPGAFTTTAPEYPNYIITIGSVLTQNALTGSIFINVVGRIEDILDNGWNGGFLESIDFTIAAAGPTITGSLERDGGGDLTMNFSDGFTVLDTSPAVTIVLTPGTDNIPQTNFIYILKSAKVLAVSVAGWPVTEHIKVCTAVLRTAATTITDGALGNRNWNDHIAGGTGSQGHIQHISERLRQEPANWDSGALGALTIVGASSPDDLFVSNTSGVVYQLHRQTFPALDMATGDDIHMVNDPVAPYKTVTNLNTELTDASGVSLSNRYYSLVVWGVQNRTGEQSHLMCNLPTNSYGTAASAIADAANYSVKTIPSLFKGTGFLIARFTVKHSPGGGGAWTLEDTEDLRGVGPTGGGAGGAGVSEFTGLLDTPASYVGEALKLLQINAGETALEFITNIYVENTGDTMTGQLFIDGGADEIQLIVQANATQTANILEVQDSAAAVLLSVANSGNVIAPVGNLEVSAGVVGVGVAPNVLYTVYAKKTFTSTTGAIGINSDLTVSPSGAAVGDYVGVLGVITGNTAQTLAGSNFYGVFGSLFLTGATTYPNAYGLFGRIRSAGATTTITNAYGVRLDVATVASGTITNAYGIYVNSVNTGSSLNYAIFTNLGSVFHNDDLHVKGSQDAIQLRVQGYSTQTSNILEVQDSAALVMASISGAGAALFQNKTDSLTGFQVLDADGGTPVFNVDTTNERAGIGTAAPDEILTIVGNAGASLFNYLSLRFNDAGTADYSIGRDGSTGFLRLSGSQAGAFVGYSFEQGGTRQSVILGTGGAVFNEQGNAVDFRVEGNTQPNLFRVDGANDIVKIRSDNSGGGATSLSLINFGAFATFTSTQLDFSMLNSASIGQSFTIMSSAVQTATSGAEDGRFILRMIEGGASRERLRIEAGQFIINELGDDVDFRVEGITDTHLLFANAGLDAVGIGRLTPGAKLHVDQTDTVGAIPVLTLDQADISEEMIEFITTIGTGNAIEAIGAKALTTTHFIKVTLPGGLTRYIPVGTIA